MSSSEIFVTFYMFFLSEYLSLLESKYALVGFTEQDSKF